MRFFSRPRKGSNGNGNGATETAYQGRDSYLDHVKDPATGLYVEEFFHEMLCLERRRKERSKRRFLLLLLDISALRIERESSWLLEGICGTLMANTREIDLKGWYCDQTVVGVILPELNGTPVEEAKSIIREKLQTGFEDTLGQDQAGQIRMTFHCFPEDGPQVSCECAPDLTLYPDLQKHDPHTLIRSFAKRAIDICGSTSILLVTLPFLLVIALAVKFTSKGPVLFKQRRVGRYGKPFTFLKFRSMYVNNDESIHKKYVQALIKEQAGYATDPSGKGEGTVYKIHNDPRVTSVGHFLRKTSLDEFPQFINVLLGEMSLVGPRPPIPYELECYDVWHRRRILEMKPGITGIWQVSGRSRTTFDEMVRMDLNYTRTWSLWLDLKILVATPWVLLTGKGGY